MAKFCENIIAQALFSESDADEYSSDIEEDMEEYEEDEYDEEEEEEDYYDYEYTEYIPKLTYNCSSYYDNTWATVAGWGATFKSESSCILRAAQTRIYPNSDPRCLDEETDGSILSEDKICAYNPDWDTDASCQAESPYNHEA